MIADTIAYAWTNTEFELLQHAQQYNSTNSTVSSSSSSIRNALFHYNITIPPLPPFQHMDDSIEALKSCQKVETNYEHKTWSLLSSSHQNEWTFIDVDMKEGWQYDHYFNKKSSSVSSTTSPVMISTSIQRDEDMFEFGRRNLIILSNKLTNVSFVTNKKRTRELSQNIKKLTPKQRNQGNDNQVKKIESSDESNNILDDKFFEKHKNLYDVTNPCGHFPGISFKMHFIENENEMNKQVSTLLISYLRSYEKFGRAIVIIDSNENQIYHILKTQYHYFQTCLSHYITISKNDNKSPPKIQARTCNQMLSGEYDMPFTLNGHWNDNSSQTAIAVFNTQYILHKDPFLSNTLVYLPFTFEDSKKTTQEIKVEKTKQLGVTSPGWHNVTIALLKEGSFCANHTSTPSQDHNQLVQFNKFEKKKNFSKFKVLGVKSC